MSLLSASHPTALSAACPSLPFPPGLHLSLALFLSSSLLPSLSLLTFSPLSPFLLYSPSSFTFPSARIIAHCPFRIVSFCFMTRSYCSEIRCMRDSINELITSG